MPRTHVLNELTNAFFMLIIWQHCSDYAKP